MSVFLGRTSLLALLGAFFVLLNSLTAFDDYMLSLYGKEHENPAEHHLFCSMAGRKSYMRWWGWVNDDIFWWTFFYLNMEKRNRLLGRNVILWWKKLDFISVIIQNRVVWKLSNQNALKKIKWTRLH